MINIPKSFTFNTDWLLEQVGQGEVHGGSLVSFVLDESVECDVFAAGHAQCD